jgi:hypothetical protein
MYRPGAVPLAFGSTAGAARHHRLPPVDLRHRHAAPPEALAYRVADRHVLRQRQLQR